MGYYTDANNDGMYDLIFMSEEQIYANENSRKLFYGLAELTSIDLSNFKTDGVKDMVSMFDGCIGLTSLDLSNFNTSKVINMEDMFKQCNELIKIYVSEYNSATQKGWTTINVTKSSNMFEACNKLVGGNGTQYNSNYIDATYARIDTASTPGYLTKKN